MNRPRITVARLLAVLFAALLLGGCQGLAFSPESAVLSEIANQPMPDFTLEPGSAQILQNVPLGNDRIVLVGFRGTREGTEKQFCLFEYQVVRRLGGWGTSGGGGGCQGQDFGPEEIISIGSSISSGDNITDFGVSTVSGWVLQEAVDTIRVFWEDGEEQSASVQNQTYLAARVGEHKWSKIEVWDNRGNLLHQYEVPAPAPGKEEAAPAPGKEPPAPGSSN